MEHRDELLASPDRSRPVPEVLVPCSVAFSAAEGFAIRAGDSRELAFQHPSFADSLAVCC